jgi:hypothetical protein
MSQGCSQGSKPKTGPKAVRLFYKSSNLKSFLVNKFNYSNLNRIYEFVIHMNRKSTNHQISNIFYVMSTIKTWFPEIPSPGIQPNIPICQNLFTAHISNFVNHAGDMCTIHHPSYFYLIAYRTIVKMSLKI